jgi:hypothetical protein
MLHGWSSRSWNSGFRLKTASWKKFSASGISFPLLNRVRCTTTWFESEVAHPLVGTAHQRDELAKYQTQLQQLEERLHAQGEELKDTDALKNTVADLRARKLSFFQLSSNDPDFSYRD